MVLVHIWIGSMMGSSSTFKDYYYFSMIPISIFAYLLFAKATNGKKD